MMAKSFRSSDEWQESDLEPDERIVVRECSVCTQELPCRYIADPYVQEISGAEVKDWWCKCCSILTCQDV